MPSATATPSGGYVGLLEHLFGPVPLGHTDDQLVGFLGADDKWDGLSLAALRGGLAGLKRDFPLAYAIVVARTRKKHGQSALNWLVRHDRRLLELATNSIVLVERLKDDRDAASSLGHTLEYAHLDAAIDARTFGYDRAVVGYKAAGDVALLVWEALLEGDPRDRAVWIARDAWDEQAAFDRRARDAQRREAAGRTAIGDVVAEREVVGPNDDVELVDLLYPLDGCATQAEAIVFARMAGQMAAVLEVEGRWFAYKTDRDYDYGDVWDAEADEDGRSTLIPVGGTRAALVLQDGYLLTAPGAFYQGGDLSAFPRRYWDADLGVLQTRAAELSNDQLLALFGVMCVDWILMSLADAAGRLAKAERELDRSSGAILQIHSAALRHHILAAARMAAEFEDRAPSDAELDRLVASMAAIGQITRVDRIAATMVEDKRSADDEDPPDDDDVVDLLAGLSPEAAVAETLKELAERKANIGVARRRLYRDPGAVMGLESIHEQVIFRFPEDRVGALLRAITWRRLKDTAAAIGLALATASLLVAGALTGGVTALVAAGMGVGMGGYETAQGFQNAREMAVMAELDLADGFALATPDEVAWVNTMAWVGAGFALLDVVGFVRGVRQLARMRTLLRTAEVSAALGTSGRSLRRVARDLGMDEDVLIDMLERLEGPARDRLLRRIRAVTATRAGGARAGSGMRYTGEQVIAESRKIMNQNDRGKVLAVVQRGGPQVDPKALERVKHYLFNSPGIGLQDYNIDWWRRLANDQATVADMATLAHELAEIDALQRTGFDYLGKGFAQMRTFEREQWLAAFEGHQLAAHAKALEGEYDFLAQQVRAATGGKVDVPREVVAAIDPRGAQPGHRTDAYVHLRTDSDRRLQNDPRLSGWLARRNDTITLTPAVQQRLGLTPPVRLGDLVLAVKNARPQRTLVIAGDALNPRLIPDVRTAATGGIRRITRRVDAVANYDEITIEGRILTPIPRNAAPNYNDLPEWAVLRQEHGIPSYHAAHLWGPGFGDEARAGMLLAPEDVNLVWQNAGAEGRIRELFALANSQGAELWVKAVARNHGSNVVGGASLAQVKYVLTLRRGDRVEEVGRIAMSVDPPPSGRVYDVDVSWKL